MEDDSDDECDRLVIDESRFDDIDDVDSDADTVIIDHAKYLNNLARERLLESSEDDEPIGDNDDVGRWEDVEEGGEDEEEAEDGVAAAEEDGEDAEDGVVEEEGLVVRMVAVRNQAEADRYLGEWRAGFDHALMRYGVFLRRDDEGYESGEEYETEEDWCVALH